MHNLARTEKYIPSPSLLRPQYSWSESATVANLRQSTASLPLDYGWLQTAHNCATPDPKATSGDMMSPLAVQGHNPNKAEQ